MGHFSDLAIQMQEQRLKLDHLAGLRVCSTCFGDPHLAAFVEAHADAERCDYCGRSGGGVAAAPIADVLEHILPFIEREYENPDGAMPRDPDTGDWIFSGAIDAREMLESYIGLELPNDGDGKLMQGIADALPEQEWCPIDPLRRSKDEAIVASWMAFCHIIKHKRRFFFLQHRDAVLERDLDEGEAAFTLPELLDGIATFARDNGMLITLSAGAEFVRCQELKQGEHDFSPRRMGPPPFDLAKLPNRMSPAGVPMFYAAIETETAIAEVADGPGRFAAGHFATTRNITVLDLRKTPDVPSLFDELRLKDRPFATFMASFVEAFREPIDRKYLPHIDYLPTQVVTEYFRTVVVGDGKRVEGILYASTKDGRDAVVLFAENDAVIEAGAEESDEEPWLEMTGYRELDYTPKAGES